METEFGHDVMVYYIASPHQVVRKAFEVAQNVSAGEQSAPILGDVGKYDWETIADNLEDVLGRLVAGKS